MLRSMPATLSLFLAAACGNSPARPPLGVASRAAVKTDIAPDRPSLPTNTTAMPAEITSAAEDLPLDTSQVYLKWRAGVCIANSAAAQFVPPGSCIAAAHLGVWSDTESEAWVIAFLDDAAIQAAADLLEDYTRYNVVVVVRRPSGWRTVVRALRALPCADFNPVSGTSAQSCAAVMKFGHILLSTRYQNPSIGGYWYDTAVTFDVHHAQLLVSTLWFEDSTPRYEREKIALDTGERQAVLVRDGEIDSNLAHDVQVCDLPASARTWTIAKRDLFGYGTMHEVIRRSSKCRSWVAHESWPAD